MSGSAPGKVDVNALEEQIEKLSSDLVDAYEALTLVYRTVSGLGGLFRIEDITRSLLGRSVEAVDADSAVLYLARADGRLERAAERGDLAERLLADAPSRLMDLGRALFLHGDLAASFARAGSRPPEHLLAAPLETGGRPLGLLLIERCGERRFTTGDVKLVAALAGLTAVAVANYQHYRAVAFERRMLEGVIRSIGEGIVVCDDGWRSRLTNQAGRALLELGEEEPEGYDVLDRLSTYRLSIDVEALRAPLSRPLEFTAVSRDRRGSLVLRGRAFRTFLGAEGEPCRVLCLRDVTRETHEAWAQRDFLSLASHKLRTPLTKILGLLPIVRDEEADGELRREAIDGIGAGADELKELIDGILRFVEFRHGDRVVQPVDVRALLEGVVEQVRGRRPERVVEVEMIDETEDAVVYGSRRMFHTLFFQLVDNAVKFTPGRRAFVGIRLSMPMEGRLRVEVVDRGEGMTHELLRRLFQPFSQRDEDFTGQADGAGLGLILARQAVEGHGGTIRALSAPGQGTRMIVDLSTETPKGTDP